MSTKPGRSRHTACRGLLAAALSAWAVTLPASFAGEHPEHPTAKTPAAATPAETEASVESAGVLDGKAFAGELGKSGETTGDKDEFIFKAGKFVSTACVKYGFNEASYVATEGEGTVSFTSEPKNAQGETMSWKGTVKGDQIEGKAIHQTSAGQTEYWFKGTLKTAGSESDAAGSGTKSEHPEHPR